LSAGELDDSPYRTSVSSRAMALVSTATRGEGIDSPDEIPAVRLPADGPPTEQVCKKTHVKMSWEASFMLAMKVWWRVIGDDGAGDVVAGDVAIRNATSDDGWWRRMKL
jgi:hypothetical protein